MHHHVVGDVGVGRTRDAVVDPVVTGVHDREGHDHGVARDVLPGARGVDPAAGPADDDGELDLVIFRGRGRRVQLGFAGDLVLGRHSRRADLEIRRVREVRISPGTPLQVDGDVIPFEEATTVFADPLAMVIADAIHASRTLIIGESIRRRVLLTVFVERDEEEIRIISARRATNRERRNYEQRQEA